MDDFEREFRKLGDDVDALAWKGGTSPSYRASGIGDSWWGALLYWLFMAVIQIALLILIPLALFWAARILLALMGHSY